MAEKPFPYPYGSHLHWLWGWGQRVGVMLDEREERTELDWMVFRPDELADNAMMRFSIDYPAVIAELRAKLQGTSDAFDEFLVNRGKSSAALFSDWMEVLQSRIIKAAELIAEREGVEPHPASIPVSKIRSWRNTEPAKPSSVVKTDNRQTDTKTDTPKKKRKMNTAAVDCCRIFRAQRSQDDTISMKQVVVEYVDDNGGSVDSIYRTLNDNPDQWRDS